MSKNSFQDIVKSTNTTSKPAREPSQFFSELAKATNKTLSRSGDTPPVAPEKPVRTFSSPEQIPEAPTKTRSVIWVIAGLALLILFFALSFFFAGATVTIYPKTKTLDLNTTLTAKKDAVDGSLPFQLMVVKGEYLKTATATSQNTSSAKSHGIVILYNNYSTSSQHLLVNTRLKAASNGKIYFTDTAPTIPGYTKKGTVVTPGQVEVAVTAEAAGSEYDSPLTDFSIVGFAGTPKADKFFGRAKTIISGGSSGPVYTLPEADQKLFIQDGQSGLIDVLTKKATAEIPDGYVLYTDASSVVPEAVPPTIESSTADLSYTFRGSLYAFIFDRAKLGTAIAQANLSDLTDKDSITIPNITTLHIDLKDKATLDWGTTSSIDLTLTGKPTLLWGVPLADIKTQLLGIRKKEFQNVMKQFTSVDTARVVVRPFWSFRLPEKESAVHLIEQFTVDGVDQKITQ